jgi:hypothetical protein
MKLKDILIWKPHENIKMSSDRNRICFGWMFCLQGCISWWSGRWPLAVNRKELGRTQRCLFDGIAPLFPRRNWDPTNAVCCAGQAQGTPGGSQRGRRLPLSKVVPPHYVFRINVSKHLLCNFHLRYHQGTSHLTQETPAQLRFRLIRISKAEGEPKGQK